MTAIMCWCATTSTHGPRKNRAHTRCRWNATRWRRRPPRPQYAGRFGVATCRDAGGADTGILGRYLHRDAVTRMRGFPTPSISRGLTTTDLCHGWIDYRDAAIER